MELSWKFGDDITKHKVVPDQSTYPIGSWNFNGDLDDPKSCISLKSSQDSFNVSSFANYATWDNLDSEGNLTLEDDNSEICVEGLSGDDMSWLKDTVFSIDQVPFRAPYYSENMVSIPEEGIVLDNRNMMFSQSILALDHEGDCLDLGTPSPPLSMTNDTRIWNMSIVSVAMNDAGESNDSIRLFTPESSVISECIDPYAPELHTIVRGPALSVGTGESKTQKWIGSVEVIGNQITFENFGSSDVPLNIEFDGNGQQWSVSNDEVLSAGQITNVSVTSPNSGVSFSWLELKDEEVILHLVNHEV